MISEPDKVASIDATVVLKRLNTANVIEQFHISHYTEITGGLKT
jgi:hypothetical protein